jgi:hypothetical protein
MLTWGDLNTWWVGSLRLKVKMIIKPHNSSEKGKLMTNRLKKRKQ